MDFETLDRAKLRVRTFYLQLSTFILLLSKGTYLNFTPLPRVRVFILPLSKGKMKVLINFSSKTKYTGHFLDRDGHNEGWAGHNYGILGLHRF